MNLASARKRVATLMESSLPRWPFGIGIMARRVHAEVVTGARRTAAWRRIVVQSPAYQAYRDKTDRRGFADPAE